MTHTRYAIRAANGEYVGHRQYSFALGSYRNTGALETARLYTRKSDAAKAVGEGEEVVPVALTLAVAEQTS